VTWLPWRRRRREIRAGREEAEDRADTAEREVKEPLRAIRQRNHLGALAAEGLGIIDKRGNGDKGK
jgi:hypothetical protein